MFTDARIDELEAALGGEDSDSRAIATELLRDLRAAHTKIRDSERLETAYVDEIQRLNDVVRELIEYVESVAEIAQDDSRAAGVSSDIKRQAVNLIMSSVQSLREREKERNRERPDNA